MKKLTQLLKESQHLDYRRMNVGEEEEAQGMTKEEKRAFVEAVAAYRQLGEMISHKGNISEIHDSIKGIVENANNLTLKETGDWFDRVTVQRHMKSMNESFKVFSNTIKEVSTLQQRLESSYDEIGEVLGKYYEIKEGNEFGAERAKAIAGDEDSFEVDGKSYKVTGVDAEDKENAEEFANESMKLTSLLKKESVNEEINTDIVNRNINLLDKAADMAIKNPKGNVVELAKIIKKYISGIRNSIKESVNEGVSPADMDKIKGAVEAASSFMSVGSELKKLGMKYTFATEPLPIYIIQPTPNNKVAVVNKKYATKPNFVVGDIAVGIMEGKLNEEEIRWNAVENAIINFLKMNTKILDKRVKDRDTEGTINGLKSIISGLTNAQRSLKLESVNEENKPTNPELWSRAKAAAKAKYDVYPSAYANGYASKWYKEKGGSWKTENASPTDMEEGNEFGAERARAIAAGKDSFEVDGKSYKVTGVDAQDKENAKDFTNESMKLTSMLKKLVNEGRMGKDEINQQLINIKNPKELGMLVKNMWNADEENLFMRLYLNVVDSKLEKALFDAVKEELKRYSDGLV